MGSSESSQAADEDHSAKNIRGDDHHMDEKPTPRRKHKGHYEGFEDFLLHDGKSSGDGHVKSRIWKVLHHRFFETLIVTLVFTDIFLLAAESAIDHHLLCINGRVEDPSAGQEAHIHYSVPRISLARAFLRHSQTMHQLVPDASPYHSNVEDHAGHGHSNVEDHAVHADHGHGHGGSNKVLVCETRDGHHAHTIVHWCHMASIGILVVFLAEILLKILIKPEQFLHNWFLIIDAVIVFVSLLVDTVVTWYVMSHSASKNEAEENRGTLTMVVAVLLFVRLWRVVRIVHGLLGYIHEHQKHNEKMERKSHEHKKAIHQLKDLCDKHRVEVPADVVLPKSRRDSLGSTASTVADDH